MSAGAPARAFDDVRPPAPDQLDVCVHCGFCLPTCPTYALWGEEMDSPRGRLYLVKMASEGALGMEPALVRHLDRCLGCMACIAACPSGVRYDAVIEEARARIEAARVRSAGDAARRSADGSSCRAPPGARIAPLPGRPARTRDESKNRTGSTGGVNRAETLEVPAPARTPGGADPPALRRGG